MEIIYGGIYKGNNRLGLFWEKARERLNDQWYNVWYPVRVVKDDKDEVYMIDAYQFEVPYEARNYNDKSYEKLLEFLKALGEGNNYMRVGQTHNYYYSAAIKLTEQSIKAFDLICDLNEFEYIDEERRNFYNKEDVRSVMLWNYQFHGDGCYLVRKNAKYNYERLINSLYYQFINAEDYRLTGIIKDLNLYEKEAIENKVNYDEGKVKYCNELYLFMENQKSELNNFKNKLYNEYLKKEEE